jgi:hypothetical protein
VKLWRHALEELVHHISPVVLQRGNAGSARVLQ